MHQDPPMNGWYLHRRAVLQAALGWITATKTSGYARASSTDAAESPARDAVPIDPKTLLAAQLCLGRNLVDHFAQGDRAKPNIIVSPASLATIMALLELGASDNMRAALHRTLGFLPDRAPTADFRSLRTSAGWILGAAAGDSPLSLANMLVFDPTAKPSELVLSRLSAVGVDVLVESLAEPMTVDLINRFVNDRTKGLVPTMLSKPPDDTGLLAINALYFKDRWQIPFDPDRTRTASFQKAVGNPIDVSMMHSSNGRYPFRQNDEFVAVELSYATEGYQLVIITSKNAPQHYRAFAPVSDWLDGQGFALASGYVAIPKFSSSASADLLAALDSMGLQSARKQPGSLSGLSAVEQNISGIVQKTELRINEEGTVAAAATAVAAQLTSDRQDYVNLIVDKPFIFALREHRTGVVLVTGYISEPTVG